MEPMTRFTCTAEGPNQGRTCLAGQMPNPPTPVSAIAATVYQVDPGDFLIQWEDDKSFYGVGAAALAQDFEPIEP